MLVERVSITNDAPAISYTYGDFSGSWESIIVESPPGSRALQRVADLPLVNATLAPEAAALAPGSGALVQGSGTTAQEDVDGEPRAESPIEEGDDVEVAQEEDVEEDVGEADATPAIPRRSYATPIVKGVRGLGSAGRLKR
jgi:hypothetical protein